MPNINIYQFLTNQPTTTGDTTMTVANVFDTLQTGLALEQSSIVALARNTLASAATQLNAKIDTLSAKQAQDVQNLQNLITQLQAELAIVKIDADNFSSREFGQLESSLKATLESNPQLLAAAAGTYVLIDGQQKTLASVLTGLLNAPKVVAYENLRDSAGQINGAKITTDDSLVHVFNLDTDVSVDGIQTVVFKNPAFYGLEAVFDCKLEEVSEAPIVAGDISIPVTYKRLKSHSNIQVLLSGMVDYVAPANLITPDLNNDGTIGSVA